MGSEARTERDPGLGAEVRQSLVLLTACVGMSVLVTAAATLLGW